MKPDERGRGILTPADREFLSDPDEYSPQAAYGRREKIAERVENGLLDFHWLAQKLNDEALEQVFATDDEWTHNSDGELVHEFETPAGQFAVPAAVEFLIRVSRADGDRSVPAIEFGIESGLAPFMRDVEQGVEKYLGDWHGIVADVSVDIAAENVRDKAEYPAELEARDEPLPMNERLKASARLSRLGYSTEEILDLLGDPDDGGEE